MRPDPIDLATASDQELYDRLTPKPDLWERRFYYWFSLRLLRRLAPRPVTPDQVTAVSLLVGLVGTLLIFPFRGWSGWLLNLLGVVLLNLANIGDALDGQLARYRGRHSLLGWYWDVVADQAKLVMVTVVLIFIQENPLVSAAGWLFLVVLGLKHFLHLFIARAGEDRLWAPAGAAAEEEEEYADLEYLYRGLVAFDGWRQRARLGFLTVGEFYLIVSAGILVRQPGAALLVLLLYALAGLAWTLAWGAVRVAWLGQVLARARRDGLVFYVFGAGSAGRRLRADLTRAGLAPRLFIDNDPGLAGSTVDGVMVVGPADLKPELPPDRMILIASWDHAAIRRQLLARGFPDANLLVL